LVGNLKASTGEIDSEAVNDEAPLAEVSKDSEDLSVQSAMTSSGLFDDYEHTSSDFEQPSDVLQSKEVSDDDEPLIVFEDVDQQEGLEEEAEENVTEGVVLETESSNTAASQTSDSEHSDLAATSDAEQFSDENEVLSCQSLESPNNTSSCQLAPRKLSHRRQR
jgi:hypothetical protein